MPASSSTRSRSVCSPPTTSNRSCRSTRDCVCYTALGSTLSDAEAPLDDICRLLASGKNVVSSAVEHHAYFRPGFELRARRRCGTRAHPSSVRGRTHLLLPRRYQPGFRYGSLADPFVAAQSAHRPHYGDRGGRHVGATRRSTWCAMPSASDWRPRRRRRSTSTTAICTRRRSTSPCGCSPTRSASRSTR